MKSQYSPLLLGIGIFTLLCGGGLLGFFLYFQAALGQEKDTPEVLKTAAKMELTRSNVKAIASNPNRLLVRNFSSLTSHLEKQGWTYKDRFGALAVYERGSDRLDVDCRMYSGRYAICQLHQSS